MNVQLAVIAKEPRPGFAKTRLCPPCTPEEASAVATAALADTLDAVLATPAARHVLVLEGAVGPWLPEPDRWRVVAQRAGGLGDRLHGAFADALSDRPDLPVVLVGMDTPQVTPDHLRAAAAVLTDDGCDAVLGPAPDGGYWLIGMTHLHPDAFAGVPMSTDGTHDAQLAALEACGYRVGRTGTLRDVDEIDDAIALAAELPGSRFAAAVDAVAALR